MSWLKVLVLVGALLAMHEGVAMVQETSGNIKVRHYPYQVQIVEVNRKIEGQEGDPSDNVCQLRIYQKGHLLDENERRFCTFLVDGQDVNGDGLRDVVIEVRGLGRASYSLVFLTLMPKSQVFLSFPVS